MKEEKNVVYGPLELPSGMKIKFRAPKGIDRTNVLQMLKIDSDNAVSGAILLDEYVKAKCITEVDGAAATGEYKNLFNDWDEADVNFYKAVCNEMFGNSQELQDKAKEAARFLLNKGTYTAGCSVQAVQKAESATTNG